MSREWAQHFQVCQKWRPRPPNRTECGVGRGSNSRTQDGIWREHDEWPIVRLYHYLKLQLHYHELIAPPWQPTFVGHGSANTSVMGRVMEDFHFACWSNCNDRITCHGDGRKLTSKDLYQKTGTVVLYSRTTEVCPNFVSAGQSCVCTNNVTDRIHGGSYAASHQTNWISHNKAEGGSLVENPTWSMKSR